MAQEVCGTGELSPGPGIFSSAGMKRSTPEGLLSLPGAQLELPLRLVCSACPPWLMRHSSCTMALGGHFQQEQQGLSFPLGPQHCPAEPFLLCPPQVQLALTRFFKEHKSFHVTGTDIPSVNFTNKFVGFLKTKQCSRGYGQTKQLQRCLDYCSEPSVPFLLSARLSLSLAMHSSVFPSPCCSPHAHPAQGMWRTG